MKIFCDLDGTLIDVVPRHYRVYRESVLELGGTPLGINEYWDLKRKKTKWDKLLSLSSVSFNEEKAFLSLFIAKIETPEYLNMDTLLPKAIDTLNELARLGDCYLVTLRRNRNNVLKELEHLNLIDHFTEILTGHSENDGYDVKVALIQNKMDGDSGIIIGDTEADIITGKKLGLKTFAVTSGIRDEAFLEAMQPDYVVSGIDQVATILKLR